MKELTKLKEGDLVPELLEALQNLVIKTEELATIVYLITKEQGDAIKKAKEAIGKALNSTQN